MAGWTPDRIREVLEAMTNLDEALERFHLVALEYGEGLANHGPMGAEALESLGHQAKIPAFVDLYAPRLPPLERGRPIDPARRAGCRGRIECAADWVGTWLTEVEALSGEPGAWRDLLSDALPPLLPGLFSAAGHGVIRVAHAVRALERADTPLRRRELALGLAYWSAREQRLPGRPGHDAPAEGDVKSLEAAIRDWPLVGEVAARQGLFSRSVTRLDDFPAFARAVESIALPQASQVEAFVDGLMRAAAGLYVAHPGARVAYVHAVTIPSAVRTILPHLDDAGRVRAAGFAVQAVGALHALFGDPSSSPSEDEETLRVAGDWDEIRYHAACSIQEHSIKMAEACHRAAQRDPDPIFARAAADAALQIGGRGEASTC
jgi:hypothetical protein